jgi:hypothetical protein
MLANSLMNMGAPAGKGEAQEGRWQEGQEGRQVHPACLKTTTTSPLRHRLPWMRRRTTIRSTLSSQEEEEEQDEEGGPGWG